MVEIAVFAPFLAGHADWLERQIEVPSRVRVSPTFGEDDVLPLLPDAEIVLTSHWSTRLGAAARRLRFLQVPGAGWDKIDPAGIPPGVLVANCYEHETGIAEYVIMMCLALARELLEADRTIRRGDWRLFPAIGQHGFFPELGGQTLGIVGLGRIGREVARLAAPFGMRRVAVDAAPIPRDVRERLGLDLAGGPEDLDGLLGDSDFVVIATPLTEATRGLFDAARLRRMKRTAYLINPARAEICDERDLYLALRDRVIAGAALDPWWHYPKADEIVAPSTYPYQELSNVIMTPHTSGSTTGMLERRMRVVAANINRFLRDEPVANVVPELSRVGEVARR
ncbi:MAG TPA: 2-hydroxyacid dehydrogenase [Chloroflexota bacterium]|nr:2-hydroxyacid dehydrogenase [Chloroflexota bacterium]